MPLFLLATGQALVMLSGGIDLSASSVMAAAVVAGGWMMTAGHAPASVAVAAMLAAGAGTGLLNGLAVARLGLPPFLVTLVSMTVLAGVARTGPPPPSSGALPEEFTMFGSSLVAAAGLAVLAGGVVHLLLERQVAGRWLRALGFNRTAARAAGVPVARVMAGVHVLSGLLAAVAAVIHCGRMEAGAPLPGPRLLLDVIGAALIGGAGLRSGRGRVWRVLAGAAVWATLDTALTATGWPVSRILMVKAALVLATAAAMKAGQRAIAFQP